MASLIREDLVLSPDASLELFEILIVAGAPAVGLGLHFGRDVDKQSNVNHLRSMWRRVDYSWYVPICDLERLHQMDVRAAKEENPIIPQTIVMDQRKLRRYYIYLLFRYTMTMMLTPRKWTHTRLCCSSHKYHTLKDIPSNWFSQTCLGAYPSAPSHTDQLQEFSLYKQFHNGMEKGDLHSQTGLYQHRQQRQTQSHDSEAMWNRKRYEAGPSASSVQTLHQTQSIMKPSYQTRFTNENLDSDSD